jgi:hypothetical protein
MPKPLPHSAGQNHCHMPDVKATATRQNHCHMPKPLSHATCQTHCHMPKPLSHAKTTATCQNHCHMPKPLSHAKTTVTCQNHCHMRKPLPHACQSPFSGDMPSRICPVHAQHMLVPQHAITPLPPCLPHSSTPPSQATSPRTCQCQTYTGTASAGNNDLAGSTAVR